MIGLDGVMSYAVARRTAEIGLRMALGSTSDNVVRLLAGDGLRLVAAGLALGRPMSVLVDRALLSQLRDLPVADAFSGVAVVLTIVPCAALAVVVPAVRGARLPPSIALARSN